jgi:hypothetical protein
MNYIIRIALIALITLFSVNSFSQGNLQFNRARMESFVMNNIGDKDTYYDTIVVPAGKVLKITSTSCVSKWTRYPGSAYAHLSEGHLYIGNHRLIYEGRTNYRSINPNAYPIWLSEGNHILRLYNADDSDHMNAIFSFSGIEFNVVP